MKTFTVNIDDRFGRRLECVVPISQSSWPRAMKGEAAGWTTDRLPPGAPFAVHLGVRAGRPGAGQRRARTISTGTHMFRCTVLSIRKPAVSRAARA